LDRGSTPLISTRSVLRSYTWPVFLRLNISKKYIDKIAKDVDNKYIKNVMEYGEKEDTRIKCKYTNV